VEYSVGGKRDVYHTHDTPCKAFFFDNGRRTCKDPLTMFECVCAIGWCSGRAVQCAGGVLPAEQNNTTTTFQNTSFSPLSPKPY
jgi:hypothetical protein